MTRDQIHAALIEIVSDIAPDEDWTALTMDEPLKGRLDSMDFLDVVMELRKRYGVEVKEADYGKLGTMQSCIDFLESMLADK
jgi:acyl carrier protein